MPLCHDERMQAPPSDYDTFRMAPLNCCYAQPLKHPQSDSVTAAYTVFLFCSRSVSEYVTCQDKTEIFPRSIATWSAVIMEHADVVDLVTQLCRRVDDVQSVVTSLRLSDVHVSVSANCPHDVTDGGATVRPRILPAFKSSSTVQSVPSSANSGITAFYVIVCPMLCIAALDRI